MPDKDITSAEQLDALLEEGKISREDYAVLRKAMEAGGAEEAERRRQKAPQRLRKSRKNRELGGVCAGIAERLGISPWRVRWVAVIAFVLTGGLALAVYLCMYLLLPWDETEETEAWGEERSAWKFAIRLGGLWVVFLLAWFLVATHWVPLFAYVGRPLPRLSQWAIKLGYSLCGSPVGFLLQFVLFGALVGLYLVLPANRPSRRIFAATVYAVLLLMLCVLAAGFYLSAFMMAGRPVSL